MFWGRLKARASKSKEILIGEILCFLQQVTTEMWSFFNEFFLSLDQSSNQRTKC